MKKRLSYSLSGARFARPLFRVLLLAGCTFPAHAVQVTESKPVYVAPEVGASSVGTSNVGTSNVSATNVDSSSDTGLLKARENTSSAPAEVNRFTESSQGATTAAAENDTEEVSDFGIITDESQPSNPLADDRVLLIQELQTLRSTVENQALEIKTLKEKSKALYQDLDRRLLKLTDKVNAVEKSSTSVSNAALPAPGKQDLKVADSVESKETDQTRYRNAKAILDEGGRDTKAALEFVKLLKDYPETPLKPNIYYWLAQIYKRGGENVKAESFYNRVLSEYPKSIKAASSLYSLASMKESQGLNSEAKSLLNQLLTDYPNSAEAVKAKSKLANP